jgi:hypothetical protein
MTCPHPVYLFIHDKKASDTTNAWPMPLAERIAAVTSPA